MTTTQPAIQQVKQGNPKAIEALLRRQIRQSGLRVQVVCQERQLCIYFTGKSAPEKREILPLVDRALRHVAARHLHVARVRAYRNGMRDAVWSGRILLRTSLRRSSGLARWLMTGRGRAIAAGTALMMLWMVASAFRSAPEPVAQVPATTPAVPEREPTDAEMVAALAEAAAQSQTDDGFIRVAGLPAHRVREQDVFDSKRIQLDAKNDITEDECRAIAAHYLDAAGPNGKVVVQKPNPQSPWNGKRAPYCADNLNGYGTFFNNEYFDDIP